MRPWFRSSVLAAGLLASLAVHGRGAAETLKIGVIAPLSGPGAANGISMAEGARIAADGFNARGGMKVGDRTYDVQVIAYDDKYNAADAVAAYNRLVSQDGARYLIVFSSASTLALKENIENDRVLTLTSALSARAIDDRTRYIFRIVSTAPQYVPPLAAWLRDHVKERRVVVVNPNDETGWAAGEVDRNALAAAGFEVLASELFDRNQKEFQPLLVKVLATRPELIDLAAIPPSTAGLIVRQARDLGYKGNVLKTSATGTREIIEAAGSADAVDGMISIGWFGRPTADYDLVAGAYRKRVGQEPNDLFAAYYDGANVLMHAIQASGAPTDTDKAVAALARTLPMKSVQGHDVTLDGHQFVTPIFVYQLDKGVSRVVGDVR